MTLIGTRLQKKGRTNASVAAASPTDNTFFRFVMPSSSHFFAKIRFDMWSVQVVNDYCAYDNADCSTTVTGDSSNSNCVPYHVVCQVSAISKMMIQFHLLFHAYLLTSYRATVQIHLTTFSCPHYIHIGLDPVHFDRLMTQWLIYYNIMPKVFQDIFLMIQYRFRNESIYCNTNLSHPLRNP